jgi:predicted PurR-regulated permease PerM
MKGSLFIALIQGCLTGIGFAIAGVPNPALWGSVAMISALIPGIGTSLVLIPGILFLFGTGHPGPGFGLLAWGALAVGLIDNFLSPKLLGRGTNLHPLFILFSVMGGLALFGPLGFLFGPLVLSLWSALISIYQAFILEKGSKKSKDFDFLAQCK